MSAENSLKYTVAIFALLGASRFCVIRLDGSKVTPTPVPPPGTPTQSDSTPEPTTRWSCISGFIDPSDPMGQPEPFQMGVEAKDEKEAKKLGCPDALPNGKLRGYCSCQKTN
jgi:hypothetical protein